MSADSVPSRDTKRDLLQREERQSNGALEEGMDNNIDEMDSALEMISHRIERLSARIQKTGKHQVEFGRCAQNCTNKLDASILKHVNTDQALAQLVEEDTRRTQEARKEYDVLSSLLNDGLRKSSGARMFEVLSGASIYVGIVISFVFMAPLHLIRTTGRKLLGRLGLNAVVDMDADSQPHLSLPMLPDFTPPSQTDRVDERTSDERGSDNVQNMRPAKSSGLQSANVHSIQLDGKKNTVSRKDENNSRSEEGTCAADIMDKNDDGFVDALDGSYSQVSDDRHPTRVKNTAHSALSQPEMESMKSDARREKRDSSGKGKAREEDVANGKGVRKAEAGSNPCRPGWAIPADDDDDVETLTYSKFPSCDLIPLRSGEIKVDLLDEDIIDPNS